MLICFQTQENISISIKIVSKRDYKRDFPATWKPLIDWCKEMKGLKMKVFNMHFMQDM